MSIKNDQMDLTPKQKMAVEDIDHNLLVISGPGTGKTTILASKAAYLLGKGYKTSDILITTFTNKATEELKSRVAYYCNKAPHHLQVYTIHNLCRNIIIEFSYFIDPLIDFRFLNEIDHKFLLLQNYSKMGLKKESFVIEKSLTDNIFYLFGFYDSLNEHLIDISDFKDDIKQNLKNQRRINRLFNKGVLLNDIDILSILKQYRRFMWERKILDLSQTLKLAYTLLKKYDEVKNVLHQRYKYILVDEYQDTSILQHEIFKLLLGKNSKICVVGDDNQSIYRFRGAAVANLLHFEDNFSNVRRIPIGDNFRSTQSIVHFSNFVVRRIDYRFDKELKSKRERGSDVFLIEGEDSKDTAKIICKTIQKLMESKAISSYSDVAVLFKSVRWQFIGWGYKSGFEEEGIPYILHKSGSFFEHKDVDLFLGFIAILVKKEDIAFRLFYNLLEQLHITEETLIEFLQEEQLFLRLKDLTPERLRNHYHITNERDLVLLDFIYELKQKIETQEQHNILEILFELFQITHYPESALTNKDKKSLYQVAYLTELASSFEKSGGKNLNSFVHDLLVFKDKKTLAEVSVEGDEDGVHVSTIHSAKGLEYKAVFLCEFDPGFYKGKENKSSFQIPESLIKDADYDNSNDQNFRLFYVGLTRASDHLFLAYSKKTIYGNPVKEKPFLQNALQDNFISKYKPEDEFLSGSCLDKKKDISDKSITISYSGIQSYLLCPLKYELENIYHFKTPNNIASEFGTLVHKVLDKIHKFSLHDPAMDEENVIQFYNEQLKFFRLINRKEFDQLQKAGQELLLKYFRTYFNENKSKILKSEYDFEVFFEQHRLVGSIDLILCDENKQIEIIDFKTGQIKNESEAQLLTYAMAYAMENGGKVHRLTAYYLKGNHIISYEPSEEKLKKSKNVMLDVIDRISQEHFNADPNPKSCSYCAFAKCCGFSAL